MNTYIKSKIDIVFIYLFSSPKRMVFDIYKPYFKKLRFYNKEWCYKTNSAKFVVESIV